MSSAKLQYWYAFCFMYTDKEKQTHSTCYVGCEHKRIRMCDVTKAKKASKTPNEAVMLSCSFLGLMTRESFAEGGENEIC